MRERKEAERESERGEVRRARNAQREAEESGQKGKSNVAQWNWALASPLCPRTEAETKAGRSEGGEILTPFGSVDWWRCRWCEAANS